MKRVILGAMAAVAAGATAVAVPSMAGATGGTPPKPTTEIYINDKVDYDNGGATLDIGGKIKCTSAVGEGALTASVSQAPPETPYPVSLSTGANLVVCDGQWHAFAVTIVGAGYDAGKAKATVTVAPVLGSPTRTVTKWVTVVNV